MRSVQGVQGFVQGGVNVNSPAGTSDYLTCAGRAGLFASRMRVTRTTRHPRTHAPQCFRVRVYPCTPCTQWVKYCGVRLNYVHPPLHKPLHPLHKPSKGTLMASLRDDMPWTAALIDDIRAVFCTTPDDLASFNQQIRAGLDGQPTFYARENGRTVGTPDTRTGVSPVLPLKTPPAPANGAGKTGARP